MPRLIQRVVQLLGVRPLLLFTLLIATFITINTGLGQALPDIDGTILIITTCSAIAISWLLVSAPLPSWLVGLITLVLGAEIVTVRIGQFQGTMGALAHELVNLAKQAVYHFFQPLAAEPDAEPLLQILSGWATDLYFLFQQVWQWLGSLLTSNPSEEPLAMALALNFVLWALAGWAVLATRRHNRAVLGLAPAGILLASILSLNRSNPNVFLSLLATSVPLMAATQFHSLFNRWQKDKVDHPADISLDATLAVMGLTIMLVVLATITPSFSVRQIVRFANDLFHKPEPQTISSTGPADMHRPSGPRMPNYGQQRPGEMPSQHLLGAGPNLSEEVVLLVRSEPKPPDIPTRLYWRGRTYPEYTGYGWQAGLASITLFGPDEAATAIPDTPHQPFWQEVRVQNGANRVLLVAGHILSADQAYRVAFRVPPYTNPPAKIDRGDIAYNEIRASIYRAESWLPNPSQEQLRTAGQAYPNWVTARYLGLPEKLSTRVIMLTQEIVAEAATPYEQAQAIESYLRTFPYTLDLAAPPANRELVDYFLFDLQKGYCDYYATAMAVMARSVGLPSRLVIGYASGVYDESIDRTIVTAADAHSWVEIYFPEYGWIEFEPTGGRPELERPEGRPLPDISDILAAERRDWIKETWQGFSRYWWTTLLAPLLLWIAWTAFQNQRRRLLPPDAAGAALFQQLQQYGQRLNLSTHSGDTPYEFASLFIHRLNDWAPGSRWQQILQPAQQEVNLLTRLYVRASYSSRKLGPAERARAFKTWRRLHWRLRLLRFQQATRRRGRGHQR